MARFVVSGGDFRRSDGCLSFVELDESTGQLSLLEEIWIPHPRPHMAVPGKGITGLHTDGDVAWACFSNLIAKIGLPSGEVLGLVEDDSFNDLHQLSFTEKGLVLANTGNESADIISLPDGNIVRMDLLGDFLRSVRPRRDQSQDTKPHLYHLSSACINRAGELLLGMGRQARILNATRWSWVGPRMCAPVHDVQYDPDDAVWCTTVNGEVHKITHAGETRSWALKQYQEQVGWTRGLAVTERGLLVGTTAIRESNREYYRSLVQTDAGSVDACLTWIPFGQGKASALRLPDAGLRKVFSICERM